MYRAKSLVLSCLALSHITGAQSVVKIGPGGSRCPPDVTVYVEQAVYYTSGTLTTGYITVDDPRKGGGAADVSNTIGRTTTTGRSLSASTSRTGTTGLGTSISNGGGGGVTVSSTTRSTSITKSVSSSSSRSFTINSSGAVSSTGLASTTIPTTAVTTITTTAAVTTITTQPPLVITYATTDDAGSAVTTFFTEPSLRLGDGVASGAVTEVAYTSPIVLGYAFAATTTALNKRQQATAAAVIGYQAGQDDNARTVRSCAYAMRYYLQDGALMNVMNDTIGKNVTDSYAIIAPWSAGNEVVTTFLFQDGILQWDTGYMGSATFYSCADNTLYAGFPDPPSEDCSAIMLGAIDDFACPVDLSGSGMARPRNNTIPHSMSVPNFPNITATTSFNLPITTPTSLSLPSTTLSSTCGSGLQYDTLVRLCVVVESTTPYPCQTGLIADNLLGLCLMAKSDVAITSCPDTLYFSSVLGTCVDRLSGFGSQSACPRGTTLDIDLQICAGPLIISTTTPTSLLTVTTTASSTSTSTSGCAIGLVLDPLLGLCVGQGTSTTTSCATGLTLDSVLGLCVKSANLDPMSTTCTNGLYFSNILGACVDLSSNTDRRPKTCPSGQQADAIVGVCVGGRAAVSGTLSKRAYSLYQPTGTNTAAPFSTITALASWTFSVAATVPITVDYAVVDTEVVVAPYSTASFPYRGAYAYQIFVNATVQGQSISGLPPNHINRNDLTGMDLCIHQCQAWNFVYNGFCQVAIFGGVTCTLRTNVGRQDNVYGQGSQYVFYSPGKTVAQLMDATYSSPTQTKPVEY